MRVRLMIVVAVAVVVLVSGCGDDDTTADTVVDDAVVDDAVVDDAVVDDAAVDDAAVDDAAVDDDATDDAAGGSPGTGTITVGDLNYDLEVESCFSFAGAIGASAVAVDQPDNVSFGVDLSPVDWRDRPANEGWTSNGSVRLDVEEPYQQWEAGADAFEFFEFPDGLVPEDFAITSYDISDDGRSAQGEALFLSLDALLRGDPVEPTPGSFSITCPSS